MKILYKTMRLGLLSACLCLLCAAPASAKVCFVGEENCTGGGSFDDYKDPSEDGSLCTQEGYTSKTSCQADMTKYIAGYCPYNSNYVMCCGREYSYDACVYPLIADGKCGNKFKCRCDSDKYPYKQQSATVCKNTVTGQNYDNSIASGASCVYTGFVNGQTSINAYFTECLCDRGLYPKTEEECSKDGSSVSNKSCVDSNGNTYYTACICGDEFKVIASECKYGININEPMCQQGDVLKAKKCCDCNINTYPYGDIEDVDGSSSPVASYASCEKEKGCTRGSRYRATSCKLGYKVVSGECVPKDCDELLTDYFSERNIKDYEIYQAGTAPSAKNVIIAKDVTYDYNKRAEWSHFYNKKVISAAVYVQTITGDDTLVTLAKQKCTSAPVLKISGTSSSVTSPIDFTAVTIGTSNSYDSLYLKGTTFTCTNCGINLFSFNIDSSSTVTLKRDTGLPNSNELYVDAYDIEISGNYKSEGYDYNVSPTYTSAGIEISNNFDKTVIFSGLSASSHARIDTGLLTVKGAALFKYADIYPYQTTIGATGTSCSNLREKTFATLYYSALYLKQGTTNSRNLYICAGAAIGYPNIRADRSMSSSYGSYIVTTQNYFGIRAYHDSHKSNGDCSYKFLNYNGTYTSVNKCFFTESTKHHSHNNAGTTYKLTGDDVWSISICKDSGRKCDGPNRCYRSNNSCGG